MEISRARRAFDGFLGLHRAPGTRRLYNDRLDTVLNFLGISTVEGLTLTCVEKYLQDSAGRYSTSTLNNDIRILKSFTNWLVKRGVLPQNPVAGLESLPANGDPKRRALNEKEIASLISVRQRGLIWEFLVSTGLRKSEFIGLRRADLDLGKGIVGVRPSTVKRNKPRQVPLLEGLCGKLEAYFNGAPPERSAFLNGAGRPWRNNLRRALKTDLKKQGIEPAGVDVHALRKTFATRMINRGADPKTVQHLLGHADVGMTMEIYADYVAQRSEATLRALEMPNG